MRDQVKTLIIFAIVLAALGFYAVVPLRLTYADVGLRKISLLADDSPMIIGFLSIIDRDLSGGRLYQKKRMKQ